MNNEEKILTTLDIVVDKVSSLETRFDGLEAHVDRLTAKVIDMDEYMHTELATKSELRAVEGRLTDHIQGLAKGFQDHDAEICALNSRMSRVEGHVFGS